MSQSQHPNPTERLNPLDYAVIGVKEEPSLPSCPKGPLSSRKRAWGFVGFLTVAILFAYGDVLATLIVRWWSNDTYSYSFLIPLISLYLIWLRRETLIHIHPSPNYAGGFVILFLGLFMLTAGQLGGVIVLQALSLIVTLMGVVLLLLGTRFLQVLWFPLIYLLFIVPFWEQVTDHLHLPFQLFSATIGVNILQAIGIPAYRQDVYIELPNITLEVAKVCSGINYLIAVITMGIPMAYLFLKGWWRRVSLVCFAVIIAILSNGLRVALIGVLSHYGIGGDIHGPFHVLQGLFVSMIGFGALFVGLLVLQNTSPASSALRGNSSIHKQIQPITLRGKRSYLGGSLIVLFLLVGSYLHFYNPSPVPLTNDLGYFPVAIGEWKGHNTTRDYSEYKNLGVDHELSRIYETASGETIRLYIGYYEYQEQAKELINYKTKELHLNASKYEVDINKDAPVEINKVLLPSPKGSGSTLILFWYDLNGRIVADRYMAKAYTAWDAMIHGRTSGAVIMLTSDLDDRGGLDKALRADEAFIRVIFPLLKDCLSHSPSPKETRSPSHLK